MRIFHLLTLAAILAAPVALHATPITYTQTFIGTGKLGSTSFTNKLVTLTGVGDTDNVIDYGSGLFANVMSTTFSIAGGGTGTFSGVTEFEVNQGMGLAGVSDLTSYAGILFTVGDAFATYDLTTAIGPVTGEGLINSKFQFNTNSGKFSITTAGNSTFTATMAISAVPEPSSLVLLGTGALGALGMMKRKLMAA